MVRLWCAHGVTQKAGGQSKAKNQATVQPLTAEV